MTNLRNTLIMMLALSLGACTNTPAASVLIDIDTARSEMDKISCGCSWQARGFTSLETCITDSVTVYDDATVTCVGSVEAAYPRFARDLECQREAARFQLECYRGVRLCDPQAFAACDTQTSAGALWCAAQEPACPRARESGAEECRREFAEFDTDVASCYPQET